jgi:hypothetical protein
MAGCSVARGEVERPGLAELLQRAESEGSVRVIVGLDVSHQDIRTAQDELLQALAGTQYHVMRRYAQIPFMALDVSPEALRRLSASPLVVRIQEDRLVAPQEKKTP